MRRSCRCAASSTAEVSVIHVFIGTKPEYVKIAPLLQRMDAQGVRYRLIDSGQHAELAATFRREFGLREPDHQLGRGRDAATIPEALLWLCSVAVYLWSPARLRRRVFGGASGVCVVHGDTPTTLLSTLLAKRSGLAVAHVEAGLRTYRWLHPFPEEIVRVLVGRMSDVLFAPGPHAANNLRITGVKGRVVEQPANTLIESVRGILGEEPQVGGVSDDRAAVIVTMHRVENLHLRKRREALADLLCEIAETGPVSWLLHGPTERIIEGELRDRLERGGVNLVPHAPHREFLNMIMRARFVITDGGSIQEECAMLGVPALLWRDRTDRPEGIGENVVLSHYDPSIIKAFLEDPQRYRRDCVIDQVNPTEQILDVLDEWR